MAFSSGAVIKAGTIQGWGSATPPDGWLLCDGSAVSRTLYAELFAAIGTTYGAGDGSTTFNIPNLVGLTSDNVPVIGNNLTLGLTVGAEDAGMMSAFTYGSSNTSLNAKIDSFNTNVGTSVTSGSGATWLNKTVGITTDPTKSGIVSSLSSATQKSLSIIKY